MAFSINLTKLKALFPVAVVPTSVVITIKLLSQSTPTSSQILKVNAEEDIAETNHEEEIVEPEPEVSPEPPPAEEQKKDESSSEEETEEEESGEDEGAEQDSKDNSEKQPQQQQEEQQPAVKLKFKENGGAVVEIFKLLIEE